MTTYGADFELAGFIRQQGPGHGAGLVASAKDGDNLLRCIYSHFSFGVDVEGRLTILVKIMLSRVWKMCMM